jgi:hypothetical protein
MYQLRNVLGVHIGEIRHFGYKYPRVELVFKRQVLKKS